MVANVDVWKTKVHKMLKVEHDVPGYFALPAETDRWYASHLTAEEWHEDEVTKGKLVKAHWHRRRKNNHMFDCEAGTMCAAGVKGLFREFRPAKARPKYKQGGRGIGLTDDDRRMMRETMAEARKGIR